MITSILNSGFGHTIRFIAMMENLRRYTDDQVMCLAPDNIKNFIKGNVGKYNCSIHNIYYFQRLLKDKKSGLKHIGTTMDKALLSRLASTTCATNDFLTDIDKLKRLFSDKTITCCIYHGDIVETSNDLPSTSGFKKLIYQTACKHDIFFHINLTPPETIPDMKCHYIPIPVISRQTAKSSEEVKRILGLEPYERFILIHAGSAVMENVYSELYSFYKAVNDLDIDYRIVISKGIENSSFPFKAHIIKAPLFNNGMDLVNACELVVSKPGMGILQDCIAAGKPLLFLPGDFPERNLKIQLLDNILGGSLPVIRNIDALRLKESILQCEAMTEIYKNAYSKIPVNGADILAKSVSTLAHSRRKDLKETVDYIKQTSPFPSIS